MLSAETLDKYLCHKVCLSKTSKRSIFHTLNTLLPILDGSPTKLWLHLEPQSPLTRKSTWSRVCGLWDFHLREQKRYEEINPYRAFKRENPGPFRHKHTKRVPTITLSKARLSIEKELEKEPAIRKKALELLLTGMRYSESFTYDNGWIVGKGGLKRRVFLPEISGPSYTGSYPNFIKKLKWATGLKPHDLRKIYVNHLRSLPPEVKPDVFEFMVLGGWTNIKTAQEHYVEVREAKLEQISKTVLEQSQWIETSQKLSPSKTQKGLSKKSPKKSQSPLHTY